MDINNNQQQNTFEGGMNSDTSDTRLSPNQYREARNVRLVTNTGNNSAEIHMIEGVAKVGDLYNTKQILATTSIRDYGIIVADTSSDTKSFNVFYFKNKNNNVELEHYDFGDIKQVFKQNISGNLQKPVDITCRWENDNLLKLYIADGKNPMMLINIFKNYDANISIDDLSIYPSVIFSKPIFEGFINGTLEGGLYQYSYRLYNKNGQASEISPATNLIPMVSQSGDYYNGVEQGKPSGNGIQISIDVNYNKLEYIQIIRTHYVEAGQDPIIEIIYDSKLTDDSFVFSDYGIKAYQTLTLEEYNSMSGEHIIPKTIESKNDYLFAGCIKKFESYDNNIKSVFNNFDARSYSCDIDGYVTLYNQNEQLESRFKIDEIPELNDNNKEWDCINKTGKYYDGNSLEYGGRGKYISWKFVTADLYEDTTPCEKNTLDNDCVLYDSQQEYYIHNQGKDMVPNVAYNEYIGTVLPCIRKKSEKVHKITTHTIKRNGGAGSYYYINLNGVNWENEFSPNYGDPSVAYSLKSLRRGETYRYAIVFYDRFGLTTEAKWIADIKVPELYDNGFNTFTAHGGTGDIICESNGFRSTRCDLVTHPIGIRFEVNLPDEIRNNIIGYEIVRCNRSEQNIRNLMQGVLARPINVKGYMDGVRTEKSYTPTGYLSTCRYWTGSQIRYAKGQSAVDEDAKNGIIYESDNSENFNLYQFISAETTFQPDSAEYLLKNKNVTLAAQRYLFGQSWDQPINSWSGTESYATNLNKIALGRIVKPGPYNTTVRFGGVSSPNYRDSNRHDLENVYGFGTQSSASVLFPFDVAIKRQGMESTDEFRHSWSMAISDKYQQWYQNSYFDFNKNSKRAYSIVGSNISDITPYCFSYIKLYEQSDDITYRQTNTSHNGRMTTFSAFTGDYDNGNTQQFRSLYNQYPYHLSKVQNVTVGINDCKMASTYDYYKLFNESTDGNSENKSIQFNYSNQDSVDGFTYYNNVVEIAIGQSLDEEFLNRTDYAGEEFRDNYKGWSNTIFGIGGRCMLLSLNYQDISQNAATFYNTSAATSRYNENDAIVYPNYTVTQPLPDYIYSYYYNDHKYDVRQNYIVNGQNIFSKYLGGLDYQIIDNKKSNIYKASMFGTFLCNIQQTPDIYGGQSYQDRKQNIYYSYGDFHTPVSYRDDIFVFDGDTYIVPLEYVSMHKWATSDRRVKNPMRTSIIYSIPVETSINVDLSYGHEFSKHALGKSEGSPTTFLQINPTVDQNAGYTQSDKLYSYNGVFSTNQKARLFSADQQEKDYETSIDYRTYYSSPMEANERIDSWTKFQTSNFLDVDTRYGAINKLRTFQNQLLFWQDRAFGKFAVNERAIITDNSNAALQLGTGGVLERYDYISNIHGMKRGQITDTQSDKALYWWDGNNFDILQYSSQLTNISKSNNIQNYLMQNVSRFDRNPRSTFDYKYREAIFSILSKTDSQDGQSLIFNEDTGTFTSVNDTHDNMTPLAINFDLCKYFITDKFIYKSNTSVNKHAYSISEKQIKPYIKYVVNNSYQIPKVFDIQTFGGYFQDESENNIWDNKNDLGLNFFTRNSTIKDDQYYQISNIEGSQITNREYDYRLDIPRAKVDGKPSLFGNRMRGKTMTVEMYSNSNSVDFSLQYIITKYRISCS